MTRALFAAGLALASVGFAWRSSEPKPEPYRVAFDLTSRDTLDQKAVLRWIREISTASPAVEIEVVSKQQQHWGYIKVSH